jgi:glycosyltransferase involved in cell wall biosynthesis
VVEAGRVHVTNGTGTPRISIVTPSLNQGPFLGDALESVIAQEYADLEHIVVDSGSSDETRSVLEEYAARSGHIRVIDDIPPRGQSAAVNVGFRAAGGEIVGWLNADDRYCAGAFSAAVAAFANRDATLVYGDWDTIDESGNLLMSHVAGKFDFREFINGVTNIMQPTAFFRRTLFDQVGYLDEDLHFGMDYDLMLRAARAGEVVYVPQTLAQFRFHATSKTSAQRDRFYPEFRRVARRHGGPFFSAAFRRRCLERVLGRRVATHVVWHLTGRADAAAGRQAASVERDPTCPLCRRGWLGGRR